MSWPTLTLSLSAGSPSSLSLEIGGESGEQLFELLVLSPISFLSSFLFAPEALSAEDSLLECLSSYCFSLSILASMAESRAAVNLFATRPTLSSRLPT